MGLRRDYEYSLAITSQFYFCSLPFRLDPYGHCGFRCTYCFALARGGNYPSRQRVIDPESLKRRFERVDSGRIRSVVDEFLAHRQPLHVGGMSDPFPPIESRIGITLRILRTLGERNYPTIISTKSDLFAEDAYLEILARGNFMLQLSLSSLDEALLQRIDVGTPPPHRRLKALERASQAGVPTSVRIQPVLPDRQVDAGEVVGAAASMGARHVGIEHLKLPIERNWWGRRC